MSERDDDDGNACRLTTRTAADPIRLDRITRNNQTQSVSRTAQSMLKNKEMEKKKGKDGAQSERNDVSAFVVKTDHLHTEVRSSRKGLFEKGIRGRIFVIFFSPPAILLPASRKGH